MSENRQHKMLSLNSLPRLFGKKKAKVGDMHDLRRAGKIVFQNTLHTHLKIYTGGS